MSDTEKKQDDFLNLDKLKITDIIFLTPSRVKLLDNGVEKTIILNIDIVNRKAYSKDGSSHLSKLFFEHLDDVNYVPEDFFAPPEEVQKEAENAYKQREEIVEELFSGVINE